VTPGIIVLVVSVVAALAFGGYRAATDGRFRGTRRVRRQAGSDRQTSAIAPDRPAVLAGTPWSDQLGEQATLLQFSSAFCAPCRVTRRVLEDVAERTDGVTHIEVDAEKHLDLVRRLDILRTPTTLVLDRAGREVTRAAGAPTKQQVLAALEGVG
jgi:thiol-disulfide isomerase/thioredoxin